MSVLERNGRGRGGGGGGGGKEGVGGKREGLEQVNLTCNLLPWERESWRGEGIYGGIVRL